MNPSRPFILRPVATSLAMAAIVAAGALGYRFLPLSALPEVDYPTIQVVTLYPGASPDVTVSSITAPLERQFGQMPGLRQMSSTSSAGASLVTLQFDLDLPLDVAEQEVQAAINAASNFLPSDLPVPPVYNKVNPADAPILTLAITSKTLPLPQVQSLVDTRVAQKIAQLPGVGLVSLSGGQRPAVRVRADLRSLAAWGLSIEDVRSAIANANVNLAKGSFDGPTRASTIDANDQLRSPEDYRRLILAWKNGAPVRLGDVAEVTEDAENTRLAAWANEQPAIIVNIQRQPGANVIETVDRIQRLLPQLQATLPEALEVIPLTDRTVTIRASVRDVQIELAFAVALVVLVIYVFLRTGRATLIPSVAVPLSLIGTFGVMYLAGFSINNLTLMALVIATGFVVDDAIVMIENIARHLEEMSAEAAMQTGPGAAEAQGASAPEPHRRIALQAALKGSEQIGFTIVSLTFSLIAVLIPLLFMGEVVGRLFREFAITLAVAILISAAVSLTATPTLCAKLLRKTLPREQSAFERASSRVFERVLAAYAHSLDWVLEHQGATLAVAVATLALTVALYVIVPKGFFPIQDTGVIQGVSEAPQSISFAAMAERQQALARVILEDPAVESLSSFIGVDGTNTTLNSGRMLINLKPLAERRVSALEVIRRLEPKLAGVEGITLYMQPVQDLTVEDRVSRTQYQFSVEDANVDELAAVMPKLLARLRELPQLADVASDFQDQGLQTYVDIDRDSAQRLGVSVAAIDNALYSAYGQRLVSTIFTQSNQYRVVLEASAREQRGPVALDSLYVSGANGALVPLSAIARVREGTTPLAINHIGQFPAATISFNLAPGASLGEAVAAIEQAKAALALPASVQTAFQGASLAFRAALANELWLILAAIATVYIVLGVLYESYIHPVTILSTLPSAGVGALLALIVARSELDIVAVIGIILLIGIVKKNAILMIDFALEAQRREGKDALAAIRQACLLRLRPILMTTFSALFAALPLAFGTGVGSELRHPLGITMVGGLLASQVLTLYTTPVIYLAFERLAERRRKTAPNAGERG